jgi:Tol biopolymer transport system component
MTRLTVGLVTLILLAPSAPAAQEADRLFRAALNTEIVDGDLKGAIQQYQQVAEHGSRSLAAQALVRIAECHTKLGDAAEALKTFERVVREFGDQPEFASIARGRIAAAGAIAPRDHVALRRVWDTGRDLGTRGGSSRLPKAVSADGRWVAYTTDFETSLGVRDLVNGTDRRLTDPAVEKAGIYAAAFSRDGTQLAYNSCDAEGCALRIAELSGTGNRRTRLLLDHPEFSFEPRDWSPDGKWIAVAGRRGDRTGMIGLVRAADGSVRMLQSVDWRLPRSIWFSPDGAWLAFDLPVEDMSVQRDVYVLAVDATRGMPVVDHPSQDVLMGWSPDGRQLLFASDRTGAIALWGISWIDGEVEGAPFLIKADLGSTSSLGVTNAGALHLDVSVNTSDIEIASIDLLTGREVAPPLRPVKEFVRRNSNPAWSPDGKELAYVSDRGSSASDRVLIIAVQTIATGQVRELPIRPALRYLQGLSWAPDKQWFAVFGGDNRGQDGIFRIDARTGEVSAIAVPVTPRLTYEGFFWSPDGSRLYYHHASGLIKERHLASGRERTVFSGDPGASGTGNPGPISLSPDGRWIAASHLDRTTNSRAVVLIPVEGGPPRQLFPVDNPHWVNNTSIPWTPDGRALLVRLMLTDNGDHSELWLVPVDGSPARRLQFDARRVAPYAPGKMRLHRDGSRLAFVTAGEAKSEVWVLENFLPRTDGR